MSLGVSQPHPPDEIATAAGDGPRDNNRPESAGARTGLYYNAVRILLAFVLIAAGILKGHALATDPAWARLGTHFLSVGLVGFELCFGLWLLAGFHAEVTRRIALVLFAGFSIISLYKAVAGEASCGCFGSVRVSPWVTLFFDVTALILLFRWNQGERQSPTRRSHPFRSACFITMTFILGIAVATVGGIPRTARYGQFHKPEDFVTLKPEIWPGKRFPLLGHIDVGDRLAVGHWTVILYHHDCHVCRQAIPRYESLARQRAATHGAPGVALIEVPPYAPMSARITPETTPCLVGRLSATKVWSVATPVEVFLVDGMVHPGGRATTTAGSDPQ